MLWGDYDHALHREQLDLIDLEGLIDGAVWQNLALPGRLAEKARRSGEFYNGFDHRD